MNDISFNDFKSIYLKYDDFYHVNSLTELENLLIKFNPNECNYVGYIWHEYGYIQSLLNYMFKDFFEINKNNGKIIGTCLPGMELLYRDKVDILIVLDNFINTENIIKKGVFTEKWNFILKNYEPDGGKAFWMGIKNFNELDFDNLIQKLNFKNTIWPHYYTKKNFYTNKFGKTHWNTSYIYATGQKTLYTKRMDGATSILNLAQNFKILEKSFYPKLFDEPYFAFFIRNCHKNYINNGQSDEQIELIINLCSKLKKHLILFQDIIPYKFNRSPYIHEIQLNMPANNEYLSSFPNYLDLDKFIYYTYNCSLYFATNCSPTDFIMEQTNNNLFMLNRHGTTNDVWSHAVKTYQYNKQKKLK